MTSPNITTTSIDRMERGESGKIDPIPTYSCWGRTWRRLHWSHLPIAAVSVGSTIILGGYGAYGYINQEYLGAGAATVVLISVLATNTLASFYIWKFKPLKKFEDQLKELNAHNQKLDTQIKFLQSQNQLLEQVKNNLLDTLGNTKKNVKELNEMLGNRNNELKEVVDKLAITQNQFKESETLYQKFKEENSKLLSHLESIKKMHELAANELKQLDHQNKKNEEKGKEIAKGVDGIDGENQEMRGLLEDLEPIIQKFSSNAAAFDAQFSGLQSQFGELNHFVAKVDEADDKFRDGAKILDNLAPQLVDVASKLQEALDKADQMLKEEG